MSELRSAIEALQTEDVRGVSDEQLEADFAELERAARTLEAERLRRLSAGRLQQTVAHWRQRLDWEQGLKDAERLREQRRLSVSTTMLGMVRVDGHLDPETGEAMLAALRNCVDAGRRRKDPHDHRTPTHRRVDALGEICLRWLNAHERPLVAGERPHVAVIVD